MSEQTMYSIAVIEAKDVEVGDVLVITDEQAFQVEQVGTMWVHVRGWLAGTEWALTDLIGGGGVIRLVRQPHESVRVIKRST